MCDTAAAGEYLDGLADYPLIGPQQFAMFGDRAVIDCFLAWVRLAKRNATLLACNLGERVVVQRVMETSNTPAEGKHEVTIIVNTREYQVEKGKISFDQVVKLAYPQPPGQDTVYTVSYTKGNESKPTGTLVEGESVEVKDGMVFSVTATNRS